MGALLAAALGRRGHTAAALPPRRQTQARHPQQIVTGGYKATPRLPAPRLGGL